ncbi:MAG: winged helix-turn-helix transcriptional regulator [Hyphomicrobiaceae bacterium]|nr:winged helix-turn-helix transcriptional regulator [Hyphomicrobiaceae bacterium]
MVTIHPDTLFHVLSDPTRRALFERMVERRNQTVGDLTLFAGVSQPTVSKHLAIMKEAGLVEAVRRGREVIYHVTSDGLTPLRHWLETFGRISA